MEFFDFGQIKTLLPQVAT